MSDLIKQNKEVRPAGRTDKSILGLIKAYFGQVKSDGSPHFSASTRDSYRRSIDRLMRYAEGAGVEVLEIDRELAEGFVRWLSAANEGWVGFKGPLSPSAITLTVCAVKSFFNFAVKLNYAEYNPFDLISTNTQASQIAKYRNKNNVLDLSDIQVINKFLDVEPNYSDTLWCRRRWVFKAYLYTGLRGSELLNVTTKNMKQIVDAGGKTHWQLHVVGKGGKFSVVPLSRGFMREFGRYRKAMGVPERPESGEDEPFFYLARGGALAPVATRQQPGVDYQALVDLVAERCAWKGDVDRSVRLKASTLHWLRHTFVTVGLDLTNDLPAMSELARHSDINTTILYDKTRDGELCDISDRIAERIDSA